VAPTITLDAFPAIMADAEARHAYLNTTRAVLRGPDTPATQRACEVLDDARISFYCMPDESLSEPTLLVFDGRRSYQGEAEIRRAAQLRFAEPVAA